MISLGFVAALFGVAVGIPIGMGRQRAHDRYVLAQTAARKRAGLT